jgi:hypothetical protein
VKRLAPLFLAGCLSTPDPAPPGGVTCVPGTDLDRDGWTCDGEVPDCDDVEVTVHPGVVDAPGDGVDADCRGGDTADDDLLEGVAIDDGGGGFAIVSPGFRIEFDPEGSLLPTGLLDRAGGVDLLAGDGVRFAFAPSFDTSNAIGEGRFVDARGPAYAFVYVTYTGTIEGEPIIGATFFGVTPDGRIERSDDTGTENVVTGGPWDVTASIRFVTNRFTTVDWSGNGVPVELETADGTLWSDVAELGYACLGDPDRQVGMVWNTEGTTGSNGPRIVADAAGGTITLAYDLFRGETELGGGSYGIETVWALAPESGCKYVEDVATETVTPPAVSATGGEMIGSPTRGLAYVFRADAGDVTLTFDEVQLHAGVLLEGTFPSGDTSHGVVVFRNDERLAAGVDYLVQRDVVGFSEPELRLWFPDLMLAGDRIRIAVPARD